MPHSGLSFYKINKAPVATSGTRLSVLSNASWYRFGCLKDETTFQAHDRLEFPVLKVSLIPLFTLVGLNAGIAAADPRGIDITTLTFASEDARWEGYHYASQHDVSSITDTVTWGLEAGHKALSLDTATPLQRGLYYLTAGQIGARPTVAANVVLGHEYAHFQHARRFGYDTHYLSEDTAEGRREIDLGEALWHSFLNIEIGGPAVSSRSDLSYALPEALEDRTVMKSLGGLNWQMDMSEKTYREALFTGELSPFESPAHIFNRIYTLSYSIGGFTNLNGTNGNGDAEKFFAHLSDDVGVKDAAEKVIAVAILSNLFSPYFFDTQSAVTAYLSEGTLKSEPGMWETQIGQVSWDIPQYFNYRNMSVAPTIYWHPSKTTRFPTNTDTFQLGLGLDTPVIGTGDPELRGYATICRDQMTLDTGVYANQNGYFGDIEITYQAADHMSLTLGLAGGNGETMQEERALPLGGPIAWIGSRITF